MRYPTPSTALFSATAASSSGIQPLAPQRSVPLKQIVPQQRVPQQTAPKQIGGAQRSVSTVPAVLYEKVVAELDQARRKVLQLSAANQTLEHQNDALAQELQQVALELQGDIYRALTRLQVLAEASEASEVSLPAAVQPAQSSANYSFLERLKSRQQEAQAESSEALTGSESSALVHSESSLEEVLDPFTQVPGTVSVPEPPRSLAPRSRSTRSGSRGSRTDRQLPRLSRYAAEVGGLDAVEQPPRYRGPQSAPQPMEEDVSPEEELFGTGIPERREGFSRSRERQAAQQSLLLWGILSLVLVTGCFTAGFFVVQSVVRGGGQSLQQR